MSATPLNKMNKAPLLKAAQQLDERVDVLEKEVQVLFILFATATSAALIF